MASLNRARHLLIASLATLLALTVGAPLGASADAPPAIHRGQMVSPVPRLGLPQVADGQVLAADHVGNRIIIGGSFTTINVPGVGAVTQPRLAAYFADTGQFDFSFRPTVDGTIWAIEAGESPDVFFIGGTFTTVSGQFHRNLAKLYAADGMPVNWTVNTGGWVKSLDRFGDRLFVGGNFFTIGGQRRTKLAEVSASQGRLNRNFTMDVTGNRASGVRPDGYFQNYAGPTVRSVRVTPDGTRLVVMHRGDQVGGQTRWGAAIIDITGTYPVLTPWRTYFWDPAPDQPLDAVVLFEGDLSPDGSYFVITLGQGNFPPLHDTVVAFPVNAGDGASPLWVNQMFDSAFGVSISDVAVYVGGHFCWIESSQSVNWPTYWPGPSNNSLSCKATSAAYLQPLTSYHYHLAALDPGSGRAIDSWNGASNNSWNGVQFLRVIDRGLLMGHDGSRAGGRLVGRAPFFDLGASFNA